jgi:L-alanine-DL-glutamate epimerase-like enolase superfamily enzyme
MKITSLDATIVSVPYNRRETSSLVQRDGVTDVVVKLTTDTGAVGWGESCSGPNVESVREAILSGTRIVVGRDPWQRGSIAYDFFETAHWEYRASTANFAFAGIDMALWDLCGQQVGQPVFNLLGGLRRPSVDYFCYLPRSDMREMAEEAERGVALGYSVFYLKVGVDVAEELAMLARLRAIIGPERKIRVDANGAWSVSEAAHHLRAMAAFDIDFVEQPVWPDPIRNMVEIRERIPMAVCANEGLWSVASTWEVIRARAADVLNFSVFWVGGLQHFVHLAWAAHYEGLAVCKHTHGELGIAAAAMQHACLTLPNLLNGNQQVATMMRDDILVDALPIATAPRWDADFTPGLGIRVDEARVRAYHEIYREHGQFLPYQREMLGKTDAWQP